MSEEEDEFQGVITHCLTVLLLGIETRLEGALAAMARINWAGMEMVGGRGGWVGGRGGWHGVGLAGKFGLPYKLLLLLPLLLLCWAFPAVLALLAFGQHAAPRPPCLPAPGWRPERVRGRLPPRAAGQRCAPGPRHAPQLLSFLLRQAAALPGAALCGERLPLQEDQRRRLPAGEGAARARGGVR